MQQESVREFEFTRTDYQWVADEIRRRTGISLGSAKEDLVYNRLAKRLHALALPSFRAYRSVLERGQSPEIEQFVNALTTNVIAFFREPHHFDILSKTILPSLLVRNRLSRQVRIWSAGCSSGEEPYSIAMTVMEFFRPHKNWDVRILASDLDSNMVSHAQAGIYEHEGLQNHGGRGYQRWFLRGTGGFAGRVRAKEALKSLITFRQLNLMDPWPMKQPFDIVFCRNVVIYFDRATQDKLFERYAAQLVPSGHLMLGHSESLGGAAGRFRLVGPTAYERCE